MNFLKLIWEMIFMWRVPETSLEGAEAILSHAAGEISPEDPGLVNEAMAELISELYKKHRVPVIVQGEIAPSLKKLGVPLTAVSLRQAEAAPNYLSTYSITLWMREICMKLGIRKIILVSYYPHYWRGVRAARRFGFIVLVPPGLKEMYDPRNSQFWARYKWLNRAYELCVARPGSLIKGWL